MNKSGFLSTPFQLTRSFRGLLLTLPLLFFLFACSEAVDPERLEQVNREIQEEFAPDRRVAVYDLNLHAMRDKIVIEGETDRERALETLIDKLKQFDLDVVNKAVLLPDSSIGDHPYAVVNNSVANIRSEARHSAELATQAILGTGLKVLKIKGDFFLVQTPDNYIAWVDHGGVTLMTEDEYAAWNQVPKVIYLKTFGKVYLEENDELAIQGDLVLGSTLQLVGEVSAYYRVRYPDGRTGLIPREEAQAYDKWLSELTPTPESLELYSRSLLGAPYLWGGTSTKGMDCSGFTKTVFLMNGFVIPRDASQQIHAGREADPDLDYKDLKKGDLMFFGKKATDSTRQRVTHVGIWLGNGKGEFIHSSGRVRLSSVDPGSELFDAFNTNRYLGSRRYLGEKHPGLSPLAP